jgi:DNA polymerase-1
VVNGGIDDSPVLTPADLVASYGVEPSGYRDLAALRGDPSDNLPGLPGVGTKTAARLLAAFGTLDEAYRALDDGRGDEVAALLGDQVAAALASGPGREAVERNRRLMALHEDLPVPAPTRSRLPLDGGRLRGTLARHSIRLGPSLWALVGGEPPAWTPNGFDRAPSYLPRPEPPPWALSEWYGAGAPVPVGTSPGVARSRPRRPGRPRPVLAGQLSLF